MAKEKTKNEIKVFGDFEESLVKHWQKLYEKGANYNLSPEWCAIWFKHFKKGKKLYIVTLWEDDELKFLAPLYLKGKRLFLTGTKPDVYDEFGLLYEDIKYVDDFIEYLTTQNLDVSFKHVNSSSEIAKLFIKRFASRGVMQISQITETKPFIKGEFVPSVNLKSDIKRCKNNAVKKFEQEFVFDFLAPKTDENIEEFIKLHTHRWNGGMFVKKANLIDFVRDILKNSDISVLSRLYMAENNDTAAYGIGYADSGKKYWLGMTAYNFDYKPVSPGKVIVNDLICETFNRGYGYFDFGRGSESYKSWFAGDEDVLFNISTYMNNRKYIKIRNFVDKMLKLVFGAR
jgi:hypothetical protein